MSNKLFQKRDKNKKKDKDAAKQIHVALDVSSPTVVSAGEGLYKKLALHQTNIMQHLEIIANSLDKVFDDDKQPNYSDVITQLLQQLDCAVSTTQKCLTKDVYERNSSLKDKLERYKGEVHANVALLVKWADFSSRDPRYSMNRDLVFDCVTRFKDGLNCIVRLVAENVIGTNGTPPNPLNAPNRHRRSSVNDALLHRTGNEFMNGSATLPHPDHAPLTLSTPGVPTRSQSAKPRRINVSRDSLNSDSSDSDVTINRRSDSTERHEDLIVGSLPPAFATSENGSFQWAPPRKHSSPGRDQAFHLPGVSNGEARRDNMEERPPPVPIKRRKQQQYLMSQHSSPYTSPSHSNNFHQHSYSLPASNVSSVSPVHTTTRTSPRECYDDVPPPLPVKRTPRAPSMAGIIATPTLPHSFSGKTSANAPTPPLRVDSIAGLRSKLETQSMVTPPPIKPPRTDQVVEQSKGTAATSLLTLVEKYNRTIHVQQPTGDAPPIPPKKRTVMMYNQLIKAQDYTFDDSLIPSLNIPDMVAPPPLPPKKRRRRPEQPVKTNTGQGSVPAAANGSPYHSGQKHYSISDELELSSDELDPAVDYLKVDEASPYLTFEQEEGGCTLKGGEIDALIAYAASTSSSVKQYTEAFLSTYYTFITPDELINKLLSRLEHFYNEGNQAVWQATTSLLVRALNSHSVTLTKGAEIALIEVIHAMLKDGNLKFGQLVRNALVEKLNQKVPEFIPLSMAMCKKSGRLASITDFDHADVAKQLTVLDADYFYKVDVSEMLYWAKEHNEEKCPCLTLFTMHFNNVSQWTKSRLLEKDMDWKKREKLMMYFISVMKSLREFGNFNAYLAILSAIESASVSRLDWSERILKSLEEPRALIDCRGSFKNYRQAFSQTKPPCIPYIGLYLQDLTFLEEQPSKLEDGVSINFSKRWKQFKSVDHIRFAQTKQYGHFPPDPNILGVFNNFSDVETDEQLWERSTEIKPSNRQKTATHQN